MTKRVLFCLSVAVGIAAMGGWGLFNLCDYQHARCQDGALEICDCDGAGGGQLLTGCKSPTSWQVFADACRVGDVCIEDKGGAVCVPEDEGTCSVPGYMTQCTSGLSQRRCHTFLGSGVALQGEARPGIISEVPCREGETCQTGEDWAGCVSDL